MTTACTDWAARLLAGHSIIPAPIYPGEAERALEIFKGLRVVDLPGKPTFGECAAPWVFDFVAVVFGGCDPETGKQAIREYGLLVSKKNTKSTLAAGIMLTALILCWREDEELLILAPTIEVAQASFKPAASMVRADPELSDMFHIQEHIRTISNRVTRNSLKVVAAEADTVSGKKAGRILVDELWLFGKQAKAEAMFMEATGGQVSREEGWTIYLTTQSDEPPAGVFKDKLNYWRDVRDGKINDPKTLGVLYEFPPEMIESKAYLRPENFRITNPNIGLSVSQEWLEDNLKKNQAKTDGAFQQFLAKHLNVEIGLNLRTDRWAGADRWQAAADKSITLDSLFERSEVVCIGIDGGGLDDLLGFAVAGRERDTGKWLLWTRAWAHQSVFERRKSEASRLRDFERDGDLIVVEHVGQDAEQVAEICRAAYDTGLLDRIGCDQAGIGAIAQQIVDADVPQELLIGISQGWKLHGAIQTTERKLAEGVLWHAGQPLMDWCVGNARVEPKGNAIMITKQIAGRGKIDPLMASFNAITLISLNPAAVMTPALIVL
jgi:phage terminase large subunit-like protein